MVDVLNNERMTPLPAAASPTPFQFSDVPILAVRDLSVSFATDDGPLVAADGVSFDLQPGRTTGLVGESGCGKSVTALALMGLVPPPGRIAAGSIRLEGRELTTLDDTALDDVRGRRIAMIFQEPMTALNPVFTIGEQVAEVLRVHRGMGRRAAWSEAVDGLHRVGIADAARRAAAYPHQLSGGMRQRAMIAIALAGEPDVLIADEPTTALDVTIQAQILDLLLDIQERSGLAILFISHDLGVISEVADEVLVMYAGRLIEQASAAALFAGPQHPYTRGLLATLPGSGAPGSRLPAIPGQVPDLRRLPPGCRFSDRCALVEPACRVVEPALRPADAEHRAACIRVGA